MRTLLAIGFLLTYILPAINLYRGLQKAHYHPEGRWNSIKPTIGDVFLVLCPIINIILNVNIIGDGWKRADYRKESNADWFFKPKKPLQ